MGADRSRRAMVRAAGWRAALLAFGWWALTQGDRKGIAFGVPVVAAATLASMETSAPSRVRLRAGALALLAVTFLSGSVRGGLDVALRALSRPLRVLPVVFEYTTFLEPGAAREVFTGLMTLMPGTLVVDMRGRKLLIHALVDRGDALRAATADLELRVARMFGLGRAREDEASHA